MAEKLAIAAITHIYPEARKHAGAFVQARVDLYRRMGHAVDVFPPGTHVDDPAKYDVAVTHYPLPGHEIDESKRCLEKSVPVVAYIHGAEGISVGIKDLHPYRMRTRRELREFLPECGAIVVASRWMRSEVRKYLGMESVVIPNPVDDVLFRLAEPKTTKGVCLRGSGRKYGTDVLRKALEQHVPESIEVDILEPHFARSELPALLQNYAYFVAPSRMEGQGLMACEAMATGMPLVTTRVGAIPEFVKEDEGVFIEKLNPRGVAEALSRISKIVPVSEEKRRFLRERIL